MKIIFIKRSRWWSNLWCLLFGAVFFAGSFAYAQNTGDLDYNFGASRYEFYAAPNWYDWSLGLLAGVCTKEAQLEFDTLLSTYKYCNGTHWVLVAGSLTLNICTKRAAIDFFNNSYHFCNGLFWIRMRGGVI